MWSYDTWLTISEVGGFAVAATWLTLHMAKVERDEVKADVARSVSMAEDAPPRTSHLHLLPPGEDY